MKRNAVLSIALAALLVTAGCSSVLPGSSGGTGTVNFYMSDQPGAIEDFQHLNVTVDEVTFVAADGNQTTYEANGTYDLTELKGSNASLVSEYDVESGNYTKVFLSVEETDGTLQDGSSADVKLPSNKLQLNQNFTVGDGEEVDFVYDVTVVEKGNGGYNLKPVASESGTDVEINEVDARSDADEAGQAGNASMAERQGSMDFYVSDQQNAIGDFEHLDVTVTAVEFHRADAENDSEMDDGEVATDSDTNESEMENESETEDDSGMADAEDGEWIRKEVNDTTVDLTELQGDNATLLEQFDLPAGNYTGVVIQVDAVNGTLTDGSEADVKLPSEKIRLNENFRVEANESGEFVYDVTVVQKGNGGYNLKPVASESGTDVPIHEVEHEDHEDDDSEEMAGTELNATFVGNVSAGENATVAVTQNGTAVENATVEYDGTEYTTDADGEVTFAVPDDATDVVVTVSYDDSEVELEREFGSDDSDDASENGSDNGQYRLAAA